MERRVKGRQQGRVQCPHGSQEWGAVSTPSLRATGRRSSDWNPEKEVAQREGFLRRAGLVRAAAAAAGREEAGK